MPVLTLGARYHLALPVLSVRSYLAAHSLALTFAARPPVRFRTVGFSFACFGCSCHPLGQARSALRIGEGNKLDMRLGIVLWVQRSSLLSGLL